MNDSKKIWLINWPKKKKIYEFINLMHIYGFVYIVKFNKIICLYNIYATVDNYS